MPHYNSIKKMGFVAQKRKEIVTVNVDDGVMLTFCLDDIDASFIPEIYDRVTLICEIQQDENRINDGNGLRLIVRKIEDPSTIKITGKITKIEPEDHGIIDRKYMFFWDALSNDYTVVNEEDHVVADCIECEIVNENVSGNCFRWRCIHVTLKKADANSFDGTNSLPINKDTANKNGIEITDNIEVEFNGIDETKDFKMIVKNTSGNDVRVLGSVFAGNNSDSQLTLVSPTREASFVLKGGAEREYQFKAKSGRFGVAHEGFKVKFTGESTGTFHITRYIKVTVHDKLRIYPTIGTGSNVHMNVGYANLVLKKERSIVIAGPSTIKAPNFVEIKFDAWNIPSQFPDIVLNPAASRRSIIDALTGHAPHLYDSLNISNYSQVFHDLLYLEECEMEHKIRKYDVTSFFTRDKEYLALAVQNVAESRPSIVVGE